MKKKYLLLPFFLFFVLITYPQSFQTDLRFQKQQESYSLRLDREINISYYYSYYYDSLIYNKREIVYDANGNQTLYISYNWNTTTTKSFVPLYKNEYAYDEKGNQTLNIRYRWNETTQSFVPDNKIDEHYYDANGNLTLQISYSWNTTTQSFVLSSKSEYYYDASGNETLQISYSWNTTTQSFVPLLKYEYAYNEKGNQTLRIYYIWNKTTQSFVPSYKTEYAYDANGNLILKILYDGNTPTQSFVNKKESRYIEVGSTRFVVQEVLYKWYTALGVYKPSFKTEYSTILDTDTQLHRMGVMYQYDTNFNVWQKLEDEALTSYSYYTKTSLLSTKKAENNVVSVYPNPTSQLLYVAHPELNSLAIQIVDLNGKQMYSGTIQKEVPLDISTYSQGMYFVMIENKETNEKNTYRIIKK